MTQQNQRVIYGDPPSANMELDSLFFQPGVGLGVKVRGESLTVGSPPIIPAQELKTARYGSDKLSKAQDRAA